MLAICVRFLCDCYARTYSNANDIGFTLLTLNVAAISTQLISECPYHKVEMFRLELIKNYSFSR